MLPAKTLKANGTVRKYLNCGSSMRIFGRRFKLSAVHGVDRIFITSAVPSIFFRVFCAAQNAAGAIAS